tara:strand:+ start:190 stop:528 length:339 start_codon:yes stop_codon:yes gene_type:complete
MNKHRIVDSKPIDESSKDYQRFMEIQRELDKLSPMYVHQTSFVWSQQDALHKESVELGLKLCLIRKRPDVDILEDEINDLKFRKSSAEVDIACFEREIARKTKERLEKLKDE